MKIHLTCIRVTAAAVAAATIVAGVGAQQAAAQYVPYQPIPQQPAAPAAAAPQQAPAAQNPYTPYTAYRTPAAYQPATTTSAYGSPTGSQYTQPSSAYPQYPQTAAQYPQTPSQSMTGYGSYSYLAQQPTPEAIPAPNKMSAPATQSTSAAMGASAGSMSAGGSMSAAQPGGCNCAASYGAAGFGAGDYYTAPGCGCNNPGTPNCGISNYFGDSGCTENQWFGGVYFMEMGRTNSSPIKLTGQVPTGASYPYYPDASTTVLTNRDADFNFREGVEFRFGSTFTIGEPSGGCQSGCGSCAPTTYAWEVAWWGLDNNPNTTTAVYDGTNRMFGFKNFVGLQYDRDGAGGAYGYNPVNYYYGYNLPVVAPPPGTVVVLAQRVRTDFQAQNLELNFIRFPVCSTCPTSSCGCNTGCNGGCGGYDACGCNSNYTGCNGGCDDGGGMGFSMYGSCGVRYFHIKDSLSYDTEFSENGDQAAYNGFTFDNSNELCYDVEVKNNLVGPQLGWTTDYCYGKWNLFCNSTFGIFDNHMTAFQRAWSGGGGTITYASDGSSSTVNSHKDAVAFLGELRVGTAYDISCHWRGVLAYRAVAITGLATAADQLPSDFTNRESVAIINSDNSTIIHGAEIGAECRY